MKDISAYRQADLHKAMVYQFQSATDYAITIAEFIWLGVAAWKPNEGIDAKAVKKALAAAGVLDVIESLDKGIWSRLEPVSSGGVGPNTLSSLILFRSFRIARLRNPSLIGEFGMTMLSQTNGCRKKRKRSCRRQYSRNRQ
jgi:hypothetical protein